MEGIRELPGAGINSVVMRIYQRTDDEPGSIGGVISFFGKKINHKIPKADVAIHSQIVRRLTMRIGKCFFPIRKTPGLKRPILGSRYVPFPVIEGFITCRPKPIAYGGCGFGVKEGRILVDLSSPEVWSTPVE